jgi:regulation of enolase protein 1 (concanavalin A-like superfamily)
MPSQTSCSTPYWVKVTRTGNTFTCYCSSNGSTWTQTSSQTITMATNVYIGLCVTSHDDGTVCTATFDNVCATP